MLQEIHNKTTLKLRKYQKVNSRYNKKYTCFHEMSSSKWSELCQIRLNIIKDLKTHQISLET